MTEGLLVFKMERLDFALPDFTRIAWHSVADRETWRPRIARIVGAWNEVEWQTVVQGLRQCAIQTLDPNELAQKQAIWRRYGLGTLVLDRVRKSQYAYSTFTDSAGPGEPCNYRVAIGKTPSLGELDAARSAGDDDVVGAYLGYPQCCRNFFHRVWSRQALIDTTWPMANATGNRRVVGGRIALNCWPEGNILWRWVGVRPVPHLPCRFDCQPTFNIAKDWEMVARGAGYQDEIAWMHQILSWPVRWSALHGIAEIHTPVVKVSTRTDASADEYVVVVNDPDQSLERSLHICPEVAQATIRHGRSTEGGALYHSARNRRVDTVPSWYFGDNGFSSFEGMRAAHDHVSRAAVTVLDGRSSSVLDLGCGNGALLKSLMTLSPCITPFGVDIDRTKIRHARKLFPTFSSNFETRDLTQPSGFLEDNGPYTLGLLMPGRLLEIDAEAVGRLRTLVASKVRYLLAYAYADTLADYDDFSGLLKAAGLRLLREMPGGSTGLVAFR